MSEEKICIPFPARIAKQGDIFIIYNTRTFVWIFLDEVAYKVWDYIQNNAEVSLEQVVQFIVKNNEVTRESDEQLQEDCYRLIDFLHENRFIERKIV